MAVMTLRVERRTTVGEDLWRWVLESRQIHARSWVPQEEMPFLWTDRYADHDGVVHRIYSEQRHLGGAR